MELCIFFASLKLWKAILLALRDDCAPPHSFNLISEPVMNKVNWNEFYQLTDRLVVEYSIAASWAKDWQFGDL